MSNSGRCQPWGTTIFCEDIRAEIGGKITLVGIYLDELTSQSPFPVVLPKFAFWINYFEVPGSMSGDGKLYISLPGDSKPSIESDIPMEQHRAQGGNNVDADDPEVGIRIRLLMPIVIAPLVLKQPGRILVRLHFGERVIRLGALPIKGPPTVGNEGATT
jgi:hypothetical protein